VALQHEQHIDNLPMRQLTEQKDQLLQILEVSYETAERAKGDQLLQMLEECLLGAQLLGCNCRQRGAGSHQHTVISAASCGCGRCLRLLAAQLQGSKGLPGGLAGKSPVPKGQRRGGVICKHKVSW